jgi:hypothetical protein
VTLDTNKISNLVTNWHVSDEPFLLYDRYICFEIDIMVIIIQVLPSRKPTVKHTEMI